MKHNILVLGDGGWGTALALLLHNNGCKVTLWSKFPAYVNRMRATRENTKFLPGIKIPQGIELTADIEAAVKGVSFIIMAVPTQHCRGVLAELKPYYDRDIPVVSVAKGIEQSTIKRPSEIIRDILNPKYIAVLSGPSHAEEVSRKLPASVVIASPDAKLAKQLQHIFSNDYFRVYIQKDVTGVEVAAAIKNIIAIAAGICDGLGLGDNTKSALLVRGMVEISRLGAAMGAKKETFFGLAGMGDLITTCISPHGRNRAVGLRIGKGETLKQIIDSMEQVAEGVWTTRAALQLAGKHKVEMPITKEVANILFKNKNLKRAIKDLIKRPLKSE
ncbi:MAG: NAD(P)H-dependent glycerol-3-phosphate dehydrogenase [Candidatus Brocadiia bacterium]